LTLEDGNDRLHRNLESNYQSALRNIPEEPRSHLGNSLPRVHLFVDVTKYHGCVNPSDDGDDDDDTRFHSIVLSNVTTFLLAGAHSC